MVVVDVVSVIWVVYISHRRLAIGLEEEKKKRRRKRGGEGVLSVASNKMCISGVS